MMKTYAKPVLELYKFATNGADVLSMSGMDITNNDIDWFTEVGK